MPPLTQCGQRCVDLATSTASCGSCEATCGAAEQAQQAFPSCSAGSCRLQCFEGLSACAGGCWDTTQSKQHCGACGHSCQDTEQCLASACVTARCPNGWTSCVGSCVTTQTDPKHCGACPVRCDTSEVCIAGHCVEAGSQWLAAGLSQPADLALDATHVYWTDRGDNTVRAVAKLGGSVRTLATEQARPLHPVVDDTHVYWSNELGGAIMRAPKDGSAVPALVAAVSEPRVIAVAGPYLYLPGSGTLDRVHKTGGVPEAFVALEEVHGPADFLEMLADGDALYVATAYGSTSRIWRVNLSTGAVATVHADDRSLIPALALDAEHVYFGSAFDPSKFIALSWVDRSSGAYAGSLRTSVDGADLFVTDFALADCGLLWTDGKRIYLSRPGYPLAAALTSGKIAGLAADETALYWTDANGFVGRLPQP